ncbi:MAG: hypothetical protein K2X73_01685 [Sphingomonas sp.]|jgi:hypothetical protein|uniref:DUF6127 family protein n=1 Tax=Sphingomonas sp. TaxID=28214 RepID=UPI0025E12CC2|nr:DUF6127 family protein [Sphingomonas sp.]MBX9880663.1 hypothetical protein [Sphingomonas sp.]
MSEPLVLAQLIAQAQNQGADLATLRGLVEQAGELAAQRALARLGLDDPQAGHDMGELRELLAAWRDARSTLWRAFLSWAGRVAAAVLLAGVAIKVGFVDIPK